MSKHTRGPWKPKPALGGESKHSFGSVVAVDAVPSGVPHGVCSMNFHTPLEERNANARLIAAAPEMLEMLQMLSVHLNELGESQLWDKVTQIIRKAAS